MHCQPRPGERARIGSSDRIRPAPNCRVGVHSPTLFGSALGTPSSRGVSHVPQGPTKLRSDACPRKLLATTAKEISLSKEFRPPANRLCIDDRLLASGAGDHTAEVPCPGREHDLDSFDRVQRVTDDLTHDRVDPSVHAAESNPVRSEVCHADLTKGRRTGCHAIPAAAS